MKEAGSETREGVETIVAPSPGNGLRSDTESTGRYPGRLDAALQDFETRWQRGETPCAEEYLDASWGDSDAVALIYHEYCLMESGKTLGAGPGVLDRFPQHRQRLERLLGLHSLLDLDHTSSSRLAEAPWPELGDSVGPYRLLRLLGEGAFARVYLAEQGDLADRLVVVKLSRRPSPEPGLLARARHPHIVEILSRATTADGALHLICMPYLGGATLGALTESMRSMQPRSRPRSGKAWLGLLDRVSACEETQLSLRSPIRQHIGSLNLAQVAAWMVARLAEALETAYRRGVIHGDIKPSNVLVASDGRPLLLDFNLATDRDDCDLADQGGTLAYMSPERLGRFAASPRGGPVTDALPSPESLHASDIYSLGLVLLELLTLETPARAVAAAPEPAAQLAKALFQSRSTSSPCDERARASKLPAGLLPVLTMCLAADPAKRYTHARELAQDLDRWVAHRPFQHCRQPAPRARAARWCARHRRPLWAGLFVTIAISTGLFVARQRSLDDQRRSAMQKVESLWGGRQPGVFRYEWVGSWRVDDDVEIAELAQRVLDQYELLTSADWRARAEVATLPDHLRADLELWLLEHTWNYAQVLSRRGDAEQLRRALALLERDPRWAVLEPARAECQRLRRSLGLPYQGSNAEPDGVLNHYLMGVANAPRHAREALDDFRTAVALFPDSFWANYRSAACLARLGRYQAAARHLELCLRALPENPALWTQLAACLLKSGQDDAAEAACARALALAPDMREAVHTRVIIDAFRSHQTGREPNMRHFGWISGRVHQLRRADLVVLLEYALRGSRPDSASAMEAIPQLTISPMDNAVTHALRGCLYEWDKRPRDAIGEYDRALAANPDHLWALYRRGRLKERLGQPGGLLDYQRLIAHDRVEELFGQQPQAMNIFFEMVQDLVRKLLKSKDPDVQARTRATARRLAEQAVRLARSSEQPSKIVDMEHLLARTIKQLEPEAGAEHQRVAAHIRAAYRIDARLTARKLSRDWYFTRRVELPAWIPIWDGVRTHFPHQWSEHHKSQKSFPPEFRED